MILLSDKRKCPQLSEAVFVDEKSIMQYDGNADVEALVCSRAVAQFCQMLFQRASKHGQSHAYSCSLWFWCYHFLLL